MITTDLSQSKRLKELGAPQNTVMFWTHTVIGKALDGQKDWGHKVCFLRDMKRDDVPEYAAYTLSELIEWLGDDFDRLVKSSFEWDARSNNVLEKNGYGETPLDALFALAIAIKRK